MYNVRTCTVHSGHVCIMFLQVPDCLSLQELTSSSPPVILTADIQRCSAVVSCWLKGNSRQPFILIGPEGCGKE